MRAKITQASIYEGFVQKKDGASQEGRTSAAVTTTPKRKINEETTHDKSIRRRTCNKEEIRKIVTNSLMTGTLVVMERTINIRTFRQKGHKKHE